MWQWAGIQAIAVATAVAVSPAERAKTASEVSPVEGKRVWTRRVFIAPRREIESIEDQGGETQQLLRRLAPGPQSRLPQEQLRREVRRAQRKVSIAQAFT